MKKFSQESINNSKIVNQVFEILKGITPETTKADIFRMMYEDGQIDENGDLTATGKKELTDTETEK